MERYKPQRCDCPIEGIYEGMDKDNDGAYIKLFDLRKVLYDQALTLVDDPDAAQKMADLAMREFLDA